MEKNSNLLTKLALISDSIEKLGLNCGSTTIIFELSKTEFENCFELLQKKYGIKSDRPDTTFSITIGVVEIVFNTNSVD
jgi:hypothetical protein